jgi:hypothetical protein
MKITATLLLAALISSAAIAQAPLLPGAPDQRQVYQDRDGSIIAMDKLGTKVFATWAEFHQSQFFLDHGMRCGSHDRSVSPGGWNNPPPSDCSNVLTNPLSTYDPGGGEIFDIPVVVHILHRNNGVGDISDARVYSQIDVLNEDFNAIGGTPGSPGTNGKIQFHLATTDPSGNATKGIYRHASNAWHNDKGSYYNQIGWDTTRYLNIYVNSAGGNLGYAYLPSGGGVVGQGYDGVRIFYQAFGRNSGYAPYDQGRTATHEVGHYLGLYHTFQGGCHSGSCSSNGDLVCDTNSESSPFYGCGTRTTCSSPDPTTNYMDYSEDLCMYQFTPIQINRMRCTIMSFRPDLVAGGGGGTNPPDAATGPSPSNGATGISTTPSLSWQAAAGADTYDIYFGVSSNLSAADLAASQAQTSFSPGQLSTASSYFWRVDSVGAGGTTTGSTWAFTTDAGGGGGGSNDLLSEDFESGTLSAGWSTTGNIQVHGNAANTGSFGARLRRTSSLEHAIDASGRANIVLSYARATSGYDGGEFLTVDWFDGSGWTVLEATNATGFVTQSFSLGAAADGNPNLRIRFSASANRNNEVSLLDDVVVSGD